MSTPAEHWLALYERDHAHTGNRLIHWLCAPAFFVGLLGILWCLPVPSAPATDLAAINWATLFAMTCIVYYFIMSITLALGALLFVVGGLAGVAWLELTGAPLLMISSIVLFCAALGQFVGHRIEASGSLSRDILYCVIAPVWVLAAMYRRVGIPI